MTTPIQLLVGLGNPGAEYARTRHNAGQDFVETFAQQHNISLSHTPKYFGLSGRGLINGQEIRVLIPTTYMNRSGQAVVALAQFFRILPQSILIAHDELDLPPGVAKLKLGGGHGGHNGLRDIISALGNQRDFYRLRLGIGHPGDAKQVVNFVLQKPPLKEQELMNNSQTRSLSVMPDIVQGQFERAMRVLHTL